MLSVFSLLCTVLIISETYGLFETNTNGRVEFPIAKWKIVVNEEELSNEKQITLTDFTFKENPHTEDGFFAPGSEAYYDFVIDASGSEVSVAYTIQIDASSLKNHPNIKLTVTDKNNTANVSPDGLTYKGILKRDTLNELKEFKINLVWENDAKYDIQDSSLIKKELPIKLNVNFSQHIKE